MDSNEIETLLRELGETPADLARRLGVNDATISRWRSGRHAPSGLYAAKVAELLAMVAARKYRARGTGDAATLIAALVDATAPPPSPLDDEYTRGYRQGYRDAAAAVVAALGRPDAPRPTPQEYRNDHPRR